MYDDGPAARHSADGRQQRAAGRAAAADGAARGARRSKKRSRFTAAGWKSYDFHGLEVLQSLIEARRGGETGISRVQLLTGDAYKQAAKEGRWSAELAAAAMAAEKQANFQRQNAADAQAAAATTPTPDHALVVTYKDGTRARC